MAGPCFAFGPFVLNPEAGTLLREGEPVPIGYRGFLLLTEFLKRPGEILTKSELIDLAWHGAVVEETNLSVQIAALRKRLGRPPAAGDWITTVHRVGYRFALPVEARVSGATPPGAADAAGTGRHPRQEIRFCATSDGVRIAYAEVGSGPILVKTANWLNHLEYDWQSPVWEPMFRVLTERYRLIRYDARGNGLSDWHVADISLEGFVRDLEAVVDAAGLRRFPLFGISQGCAISVAYAVRHPERVSHLILYGGMARGRRRRGSPRAEAMADALEALMQQGWGQENPAFRQIYTSLFIPGGTPEQIQWFNDLQRMTTTTEVAVRLRQAIDEIDITDLLPRVAAPTLVMHLREDAIQPLDEGQRLAAGIRGARFVALEGRNHILLEGDRSWRRFHDEIAAFLAGQPSD